MTRADPVDGPARPALESLDPRTGELVGTHPVDGPGQVEAAVRRARVAASWWAGLGFGARRRRLSAWRKLLVARIDDLAELTSAETGKPADDARLEVVLAIDHLAWTARNAERVLGRRRVPTGILMANQTATLAYLPYGVIGVIGPAGHPVFTPMGSIACGLAAGNAVVFKPSEHTPGVGRALAEALAEVVPEQPVLQVVTGYGATGQALCRSEVDKVSFAGATETGRRVLAACADRLTPTVLECGGKDPLIVDVDADLDAAADAAVWGGMSNAGQASVGVERVYVLEAVADEFLDRVVARAGSIRPGAEPDAAFGPMATVERADRVADQLRDALARGARPVVGGTDSVRPPYVEPLVLVDVPEHAKLNTDVTAGPVLSVTRVPDLEEAVRLANASSYGLGAAVFSARRGTEVAERLRCGMVAVNGVVAFAAVPALPFGGVGDSGFGRIHGEDGLREFARAQAVTRQRFAPALPVTGFGRSARGMRALLRLIRARYG